MTIFSSRIADPLPPADDQAARLKDDVQILLSTRLRDLKLPPHIRAIFETHTSRMRRKMMASWCLWISAITVPLAGFDISNVTFPALWYVLLFRFVSMFGFLGGWAIFRSRRLVGSEHRVIIGLCVVAILGGGLADIMTGRPGGASDYLMNAILVIYSAIMYVNIDLSYSKILAATTNGLICLFTLAASSPDIAARLQLITLYTATMLAMVQARNIYNLYRHRLFLTNLRDEITSAEAASLNAQLSSIAYIDQLTEIPNRRYFDEICASMSEATKNLLPLSLCLIDIDHFKRLNDSCGHLQGDHCLRLVAGTIRNVLRGKTDILVRYGGEEFLLLLPGTDIDRATEIAERVRQAIAGLQHPNPGALLGVVTVSIGISMVDAHPVQIEDIIGSADKALYRAKLAGRNRVGI